MNTIATMRDLHLSMGAEFAPQNGTELIAHYGDSYAEYQAAPTDVALRDASICGRIWMGDRDHADLLQRLSTNNVLALQPGQGCQTTLTNHNGRIIDLLVVHTFADSLLVVTSPGQGDAIYKLLRKNIFFNDKLTVENAGATLAQFTLYGPRSTTLLQANCNAPIADLPLFGHTAAVIGDSNVWIARTRPIGGAGFSLYVPAEHAPAVWSALVESGARPLGEIAFDQLRIEAGYPSYGRELSLDYIPLETGLWDAVSFNKGCYVGQEIIARMESRNRIAKHLRGLQFTPADNVVQNTAAFTALTLPATLEVEGKHAGNLTSVVQSPRFGWIGLGYVRSAYAAPGANVTLADASINGMVVELPFSL